MKSKTELPSEAAFRHSVIAFVFLPFATSSIPPTDVVPGLGEQSAHGVALLPLWDVHEVGFQEVDRPTGLAGAEQAQAQVAPLPRVVGPQLHQSADHPAGAFEVAGPEMDKLQVGQQTLDEEPRRHRAQGL